MYFVESGMASIRIRNQVWVFKTTMCFTDVVCRPSCHAAQKLGNSNMLYYNKNSVELKHCEMSSSSRVFFG